MPNNDNNPFSLQNISDRNLQQMYPDLYNMILPYVERYADQMENGEISEEMIDSIVEDIMRRSGMSEDEDMDMEEEEENVPAQLDLGYGGYFSRYPMPGPNPYPRRRRRRRRYPRYYISPMEDLIRLILLQQLGRYRY